MLTLENGGKGTSREKGMNVDGLAAILLQRQGAVPSQNSCRDADSWKQERKEGQKPRHKL